MREGLGFDLARVERFSAFAGYSVQILSRVFSKEEISYCLKEPLLSAERFAVRFAAKEAFYKALCTLGVKRSFFCICRALSVQTGRNFGAVVAWQVLGLSEDSSILLSVSHEKDVAGAVVFVKTV